MTTPTPRTLARGLLVVVLVVGTGVAVLWALQRQLIYFPDTAPVPAAADAVTGGRDVTLRTEDGLELDAWFVPPSGQDTAMAVLFAPGNGGNRSGRAELAEELSRRGLAVLLMDYRGYGGNPGTPGEEGLAADADAAVEALRDLGYPPERTIFFGESLGTGVVAALQTRTTPAGVVLRSPFTELSDVGAHHYPWLPVRWLLRDRFPVVEHLAVSEVPVTVIHGDRDSVVPTSLSVRVADETRVLAERLVLTGDHNDPVMFGPEVADAVLRLAERVG
ncbi:alpha/beta hydrolase [Aeromicrobium duanguangcaii]|uniref:Alpha/beta hydrolase n=1 Tax=Aeromicrobium duanguangcaii TaxID=2968086 RepID=A0ABY5KGF6_9ACTN|nr:alpha/beta hydrolase [Aeromicrobium duanguangcaii]MCD9153523.1 alpha/beta hydrolase [Aeromicrobium duanguangcaii]UUI69389.1 alpha/beta hydrolase [Aeromicrobium duanguangcaii]